MAVAMDIEVPRNGHFLKGFTLEAFEEVDGEEIWSPIDITGWTFALDVKASAGASGPPIASATFSDLDGLTGYVSVKIDGSDFASVEGEQEVVRLSYDYLAKDIDNIIMVEARGQVILLPGTSSI